VACISLHSRAELYSVLTGMPRNPRISPATAQRMIRVNLGACVNVALEAEDYEAVMDRVLKYQLAGGIVYDALIAQCALKIGATAIVTLNAKHFRHWSLNLESPRTNSSPRAARAISRFNTPCPSHRSSS